jgi:transcriptional regulator with XRE-family HTH domain
VNKTTDEGLAWLNEQLRAQGIDRAELARRGNFNPAALTNVYSGKRNVGKKLATGIASGLGMPTEVVYREFGILPEKQVMDDEEAQVLSGLLNDIDDPEERKQTFSLVATLIRHVAQRGKKNTSAGAGKQGAKGGRAPARH